jgi:hypothetical protein
MAAAGAAAGTLAAEVAAEVALATAGVGVGVPVSGYHMGVQGGGSNGGGELPGLSQSDSHGDDLPPPHSDNGVASFRTLPGLLLRAIAMHAQELEKKIPVEMMCQIWE